MFDEVLELLKDTLRSSFSRETERKRTRKIIFWYDSKQEYHDFIKELELDDTEIIKYDNNSFWIRYHIEKEELSKNIIIYLPFERKKGMDNDLLDLESSNSDLFFNPDSTTMRLKNLGLSDECRNVIKKYAKFFGNKKRETEFKNFDAEKDQYNIDNIITAILLGIKGINEDDLMKVIVKYYLEDSKKYEELFKFGSEEFIVGLFNTVFGSSAKNMMELEDVYKSLIFTYFATLISDIRKIDKYGKYFLKSKATNVYVFINGLMRDKSTKECFEKLSNSIVKDFGIIDLINTMDIEEYKENDAFECIDRNIIGYLVDKLHNDVGEYNKYYEYIDVRESKYWYENLKNEYQFLKISIDFLSKIKNISTLIKITDIDTFAKNYADSLCDIDTLYRKMYYYFDNIEDKDEFISLKNRIENIYVNDFISELSIKWSDAIQELTIYNSNRMNLQNTFYKNYIEPYKDKKDRVIVIVSDALRFECAKELNSRLKVFAKESNIEYMQGLAPSYTKLGMAALLPHKKLSCIKGSDDILVDGSSSSSIKDRQAILQKENINSIAIKYEELYEVTKKDWKKMFSGKKVVYIYHDTIDNAGEHNENKVFEACEQAINELEKLVRDLHITFSGVNLFITADHGFFYKRSKLESYDKTKKDSTSIMQKTRYSYSDTKLNEEGIISISLDYLFGENSGFVNIPKGNIIFARQGSGVNYIHGGVLPQEIIIPVIDFKSTRTSDESKKVGITYSGLSTKITNAITYLEFLQDNNVNDNNLPCRYLLHFEDEDGMRISDECTIVANYENTEVKDRFFREKFVFKNREYDKTKSYFLVVIDEETGIVKDKIKFYIDIAIINNFDF